MARIFLNRFLITKRLLAQLRVQLMSHLLSIQRTQLSCRGLILFFIFKAASLVSLSSYASPCCGQSSSSLNIMTQRQGFNLSLSQTEMQSLGRVYDADNSFFIWPDSKSRDVSITQFSAGLAMRERWQLHIASSWQRANYLSEGFGQTEVGMMDTMLGVTYELLPEYSFSYYKPIVYLSLLANIPTGRSVFEGRAGPENIAVTGHGQWGGGLALTLQKTIRPWFALIQIRSLRLFADSWGETSVGDFYNSSAQLLLGYNLPFWDLNFNFGVTQLELSDRSVTLDSALISTNVASPNSRSTMLSFGLSRSLTENMNFALSFNDQTFLGEPKNTLLGQSVSLVLSYNKF